MSADTYESLKTPPHSIDAEQSVLGGLMMDNGSISKIGALVEEDFYRQDHRLIFRSIMAVYAEDKPRDVVTMNNWLAERDLSGDAGGLSYLATLAKDTPSAANIAAYAGIVREKSLLRQMIQVGSDISDSGYRPEGEKSQALIERGMDEIVRLSGLQGQDEKTQVTAKEGLKNFINNMARMMEAKDGELLGIGTGLHEFDQMTSGLRKAKLILLAGRPSMGKTTLSQTWFENAAINGKRVVFFSLEMPESSLFMKMVASVGGVDYHRVQHPKLLSEMEQVKVANAIKKLSSTNLIIDDKPGVTPAYIRSALNEITANHGPVDMVVIDYIQLMSPPSGKNYGNENAELTAISRELMSLKKKFNCPFVVLSQLNRDLEKRPNKRPIMADLRASGSLEQDADVIVMVYRDEVYNSETADKGVAELGIQKNRDGRTGVAKVVFEGQYQRFKDPEFPYSDYREAA